MSDGLKEEFCADLRVEYEKIRVRNKNRRPKGNTLRYSDAVDNRPPIVWEGYQPPKPTFLGTKIFDDYPLEELVDYIDWTPFFITWELAGKYPKILKDEVVGEAARNLFADAQAMLKKIIDGKLIKANAIIGFWPANGVNTDDIELYTDDDRGESFQLLHHLRQQIDKPNEKPNFCLADYIAPKETGLKDYIGGFVVSTGHGVTALAAEFEANQDDYNSILLKALADRLAEALAERMHERVRKEFWGYAADEAFDNAALIKESYQGIRPAPGYPACPDHTEKGTLFRLLDATQKIAVDLSEHYAMMPASSVSGFYYSHPDSQYFGLGKIDKDQVEHYAERKGQTVEETERWLSPVLSYR